MFEDYNNLHNHVEGSLPNDWLETARSCTKNSEGVEVCYDVKITSDGKGVNAGGSGSITAPVRDGVKFGVGGSVDNKGGYSAGGSITFNF